MFQKFKIAFYTIIVALVFGLNLAKAGPINVTDSTQLTTMVDNTEDILSDTVVTEGIAPIPSVKLTDSTADIDIGAASLELIKPLDIKPLAIIPDIPLVQDTKPLAITPDIPLVEVIIPEALGTMPPPTMAPGMHSMAPPPGGPGMHSMAPPPGTPGMPPQEDACSFIQDVNERVSCEAKPFPRPCDIIQNVNDRENCKKFNERIGDGTPLLHSDGPPPWCTGPKGRECENEDGTPIQPPEGAMVMGPPPWCTGPKGRECENEDGTPIEPPMQDTCATIQDVNERLKCQGQPVLGAGVPSGSPPQDSCSAIQDINERLKCQGNAPPNINTGAQKAAAEQSPNAAAEALYLERERLRDSIADSITQRLGQGVSLANQSDKGSAKIPPHVPVIGVIKANPPRADERDVLQEAMREDALSTILPQGKTFSHSDRATAVGGSPPLSPMVDNTTDILQDTPISGTALSTEVIVTVPTDVVGVEPTAPLLETPASHNRRVRFNDITTSIEKEKVHR